MRDQPSWAPAAVLFDAGLVLLSPDGEQLSKELGRNLGFPLAPFRIESAFRQTIHLRDQQRRTEAEFDWWPHWCAFAGIPPNRATDVERIFRRLAGEGVDYWCKPEPGVFATLSMVRKLDAKVAIVSNSNGSLKSQFQRAHLDQFVDVYVDSVRVGCRKPSLEIFDIALEELRLSAFQCWYVGDDYSLDIAPAREAGFQRVVHYDPLRLYEQPGLASLNKLFAPSTNVSGVRSESRPTGKYNHENGQADPLRR